MSSVIAPSKAASALSKLQKLTMKLLRMHRDGSFYGIPLYKQQSLMKRHGRYLDKMIKADHSISKAVGLFAVAMLLSVESQAQAPCRLFTYADSINPLKMQKFAFAIENPVFVDIDNDSDLDCYFTYPDSLHSRTQFAFLKNTGTKKLPFFQLNGTGNLPGTTDILYYYLAEGMVFSDLDGDGDYDCFIGNYDRITYFENVGNKSNPSFIETSGAANPLDFVNGFYGVFFNLVDTDADGDLDLYMRDLYSNRFYENTGTRTNPQFVLIDYDYESLNLRNTHNFFIDWNKDGLVDYITGDMFVPLPDNEFYRNDGTMSDPHFRRDWRNAPFFSPGFTLYSMADLNSDGYPEAFSYNGAMASTSPVPKIRAAKTGQIYTLQAYPKGSYTYEWKRNRVTIANETKDSLKVTQSGNYIVLIKGKCGTGISLPYKVTINGAVASLPYKGGLSASVNTTAQLHVSPNPFMNECVLQFDKGITGNVKIYITDAQGRTVATFYAANNETRFGKELAAGIYFIQVTNGKEVNLRQKVVKQ